MSKIIVSIASPKNIQKVSFLSGIVRIRGSLESPEEIFNINNMVANVFPGQGSQYKGMGQNFIKDKNIKTIRVLNDFGFFII